MQHPNAPPTRTVNVLLVGTEQMLLYTRKVILEKQRMAVSIVEPADAVDRLRSSDCDVVITCHTLQPEEAEQIAEAARFKIHPPGLICFTKQPFPAATPGSFDAFVWSLSTPETLVERVFAVLPSRQNGTAL